MQTNSFHTERFHKKLNSFASFYSVCKDDNFTVFGKLFQIAYDVTDSFSVTLCERNYLFETWRQEKKRTLINDFGFIWKFSSRDESF